MRSAVVPARLMFEYGLSARDLFDVADKVGWLLPWALTGTVPPK